jgi:hypothetical protein
LEPGGSTNTMVWRWACKTGDYERELESPLCHCLTPLFGGVFLPSHNKIHDTRVGTATSRNLFYYDLVASPFHGFTSSSLSRQPPSRSSSTPYLPYPDRHRPHCPLSPGDETHTFLSCPVFQPHLVKHKASLILSCGLTASSPTRLSSEDVDFNGTLTTPTC